MISEYLKKIQVSVFNFIPFLILISIWTVDISSVHAAVSQVSVNEATASRVVVSTSGTGTTAAKVYTIYGGYAGPYGGCSSTSAVSNSVCNSCSALETLTSLTYFSCSYTSIHPNLELSINFQVSELPAGAQYLVKYSGNTTAITPTATSTLAAGTPLTVRVKWADICDRAGKGSDCQNSANSADFSGTLQVGISTDGTNFTTEASQVFNIRYSYKDAQFGNGTLTLCDSNNPFCQFKVLPGDEKVYIVNLQRGNLGPSGQSTVKWRALRVFLAPYNGTFAIPLGATAQYADFIIQDQETVVTSLSNNKITGLQNEVEYAFTIATVDDATVMQAVMDPSILNVTNHVAKPGQVVGLLDEKGCFIATAAYGSSLESEVQVLRQFRDHYLLSTLWGQKFVHYYYRYSPPVARFIAQYPLLRTVARAALWPLIQVVQLSKETWKKGNLK